MRKRTVAKESIENVQFGALALRVISHEVSLPSHFFWLLNFFMAFILKWKVAKRWLYQKVSLERSLRLIDS